MALNTELLIAVYGSVLLERSAIYCSAPITSGHRYLDWVRSRGHDISHVDHAIAAFPGDHKKYVVGPNLEHAKGVVAALRARADLPVIDPTALPPIEDWSQSDWTSFWESVITRFATALVFVDGWQFSFGCVHEYYLAQRLALPSFNESGRLIDRRTGMRLISDAIVTTRRGGGSPLRLEATLTQLEAEDHSRDDLGPVSLTEFLANR